MVQLNRPSCGVNVSLGAALDIVSIWIGVLLEKNFSTLDVVVLKRLFVSSEFFRWPVVFCVVALFG